MSGSCDTKSVRKQEQHYCNWFLRLTRLVLIVFFYSAGNRLLIQYEPNFILGFLFNMRNANHTAAVSGEVPKKSWAPIVEQFCC